jgi:hypothetical protein
MSVVVSCVSEGEQAEQADEIERVDDVRRQFDEVAGWKVVILIIAGQFVPRPRKHFFFVDAPLRFLDEATNHVYCEHYVFKGLDFLVALSEIRDALAPVRVVCGDPLQTLLDAFVKRLEDSLCADIVLELFPVKRRLDPVLVVCKLLKLLLLGSLLLVGRVLTCFIATRRFFSVPIITLALVTVFVLLSDCADASAEIRFMLLKRVVILGD